MKRALALSLCFAASLVAQPSGRLQSLQLHVGSLPNFPATLTAQGVTEGAVRLAVKVDETGELEDWLVLAYTEPSLARSAVASVQNWRFTAARLDGQPVPAQSVIDFDFRATGVVINQNMIEHFFARARGEAGPEIIYEPVTLKELDGIPRPVQLVSPEYPTELLEQGVRGNVVVEFYIDEKGRVRMPVGRAEDPQELVARALEAVRQWEFEPPTRRGRPVLVKATQVFRFGTGEADR